MSVERIQAAVRALRESVPRRCHELFQPNGGCSGDQHSGKCEADYEVRVAQVTAEAIEDALYIAHDYGKLVDTDLDASPAVAALEARVGAPQKEREA